MHPPRRVLTPERKDGTDLPGRDDRAALLADGWELLEDLARDTNLSESALKGAGKRGDITTKTRAGTDQEGKSRARLHVRVDTDLADYLAGLGRSGTIRTPGGERIDLQEHRDVVTLTEQSYTYVELSNIFDCARTTVSEKLRWRDLPETKRGREKAFPTTPALARAIEDAFNVRVKLGSRSLQTA